MGLYERDYYHDEDDSATGFFGSKDRDGRPMVTYIIAVTVVFWIADNLGTAGWLSNVLGLHADVIRHPQYAFQFVTYALTHERLSQPWGVLHILFNMFGLWMFGREMEAKYGRYEFLRFYVTTVVIAGLVWVAVQNLTGHVNDTLVGASGGVCGVLFLYVMNYPRRTIYLWGVLGMPVWLMGGMFFVSEIVMFFKPTTGEAIAHEAHLAGAAFGALYVKLGWNFGWMRAGLGGNWRGAWKRLKPRPNLKVHDPETYYVDLDSEADALLAKVHKHGEGALTNEERKKLEDYSRRMRQKHR